MCYILNIDASQNGLYISISKNGLCIAECADENTNSQAQLINVFVAKVLEIANINFAQLNAIAVVSGPGSYTGLRIAVASAKGFCAALQIPLIAVDNLYILAYEYALQNKLSTKIIVPVYVPMQNEIIYAKYSIQLDTNTQIFNLKTIEPNTFVKDINALQFGANDTVISEIKTNNLDIKSITKADFQYNKSKVNTIGFNYYSIKQFENLSNFEPNYGKETYIQNSK